VYPASLAFLRASSPSSKVTSGVVFTLLTAPPAEIAMGSAVALTLSGNRQITKCQPAIDDTAPESLNNGFDGLHAVLRIF
jgi:hypothetical protein